MKQKFTASILGFSLIASITLIPLQSVRAVMFSAPDNNGTPQGATGGGSRGASLKPQSGESAPGGRTIRRTTRSGMFTRSTSDKSKSTPTYTRGGGTRSGSDIFSSKSGSSTQQRTDGGDSRSGIFSRTSGSSTPEKTDGGSSREGGGYFNGSDTTVEQPAAILPLLPQSNFGTTISQRPKILVYLPQTQAKESVFSLKDLEGNVLHKMTVPVSGKPGVISIKVPINLQMEKNYRWFLELKIDDKITPRTPYVEGLIKRILPNDDIKTSMKENENDLLKQAIAFGKHGIWYDCVATLAKLRATQPNNSKLDKHWSELLESVELEQIDKAPVLAFNRISN